MPWISKAFNPFGNGLSVWGNGLNVWGNGLNAWGIGLAEILRLLLSFISLWFVDDDT